MAKLDDLNPAARRGYALALGSLAPRVLGAEEMDQEEPEQELVIDEETGEMSGGGGGGAMRRLEAVIQGLAKAATFVQEDKEERDAEARRNAVRALVTLVQEVGIGGRGGEGGEKERSLAKALKAHPHRTADFWTPHLASTIHPSTLSPIAERYVP